MVPLLHNIKGKNKAIDDSRGLEIKTSSAMCSVAQTQMWLYVQLWLRQIADRTIVRSN